MNRIIVTIIAVMISSVAWAGSSSFVVIAFSDRQYVSTVLRQQADYVTMPVSVSSDQKDPILRFAEIRDAKRLIQKKAEGNPDITIRSGPVTLSAKPAAKSFDISSYSSGSSEADIHILVSFKGKNRDVFTCATMIRAFLNSIALPEKAKIQLESIRLAADNPEQYRPALLQMISKDVAKTKENLSAGGQAQLSGLESPVLVRQADDENIELFINYQLDVEMK